MNIFRVHIVLKVIQTVGRNDAEDLFPYAASRFCITIDDALVDCLMRSFRHCIHDFPVKARPLYGDGHGYKSGAGCGRK